MIKIVGALLIICGTAAWGMSSVARMKNRVITLRSLITSLDIMRDEICVNLTPLPKVMELTGKAAPKPAGKFFRNVASKTDDIPQQGFFGIWMQALDDGCGMTLEEDERDVLIRLGSGLGKYDCDSQGRVIMTAKKSLERIEERAEKDKNANSKLHAFLGIAAGMMAVVVLI
ncbi:MAG: stage III sporulation protein AB [Oscillospiraceae bacterium]|nr:stage III sporulation protein AB [Oscillospiraceae bacterium]